MIPKLQETIMLLVARHGPDCTANVIQEALTESRGAEQSFGAVFTTLDRLSAKKFVEWKRGEPEARRGGRAPRLYTITALGRRSLQASLQTTQTLSAGFTGASQPVSA